LHGLRTLVNRFQKQQATDQNRNRDPEMNIGQDAGQPVARLTAIVGCLHGGVRRPIIAAVAATPQVIAIQKLCWPAWCPEVRDPEKSAEQQVNAAE
jgi:hypothetical protein